MIVNRGAVAEALERWNARRRRIFYPKTDIDFDLAACRQRKAQLANADLSRLSNLIEENVLSVEPLGNAGTFHSLFRVHTDGGRLQNEGRYVLKLSAEEPAFGFAIESWALHTLRQIPVVAFSVMADQLEAPFLIVHEAKGRTLTQFENPETQAMPQPLLYELGRLLARIHSHPAEGAGLLDAGALNDVPRGLHADWVDYIFLRLDAHLEICEQIGAITNERAKIEQQFILANPVLEKTPMRWLHGDPGHHNFFSDGEWITAIIDWEDSLAGDPVFDLAFWGTFCRDEMRAELLRGYKTIAELPADFERRYWLYYLRIAISKTVHRHFFGAKDRPGRPPASQRIQKALSKLAEL